MSNEQKTLRAYIYSDTDSVYYTAMESARLGPQPDFSEYNRVRKEASIKN